MFEEQLKMVRVKWKWTANSEANKMLICTPVVPASIAGAIGGGSYYGQKHLVVIL